MSTLEKIAELQRVKASALEGGGKDKLDKIHAAGKLTARERINLLTDEGSFIELDTFAGGLEAKNASGAVTGYGAVDGRLVYIYAQDASVNGGAISKRQAEKICKIIDLAVKTGAPVIGLLDSAGAKIDEGIETLAGMGMIMDKVSKTSGTVPQLCGVMGTCGGGEAFIASMNDFVFMTAKNAQMFVTAPQITKSASGTNLDEQQFSGAQAHAEKSGAAHFVSASEEECIALIRRVSSMLPSNNLEDAFNYPCDENDINRVSPALNTIIPDDKSSYDIHSVIAEIADSGSFIEIQEKFASNIITGLGCMGGKTVGFVANNPLVLEGALNTPAIEKAARFIRFCDSFNIPLVTLTDVGSFVIGTAEEHSGLITKGAKLVSAYSEATVPKVSVILGKAWGSAYLAMGAMQNDITLAWPTAEISVMPPVGAASILYSSEINSADDPHKIRAARTAEYSETDASPYEAARLGYIDSIIEPDATRPHIISALDMLFGKREARIPKKHGILPL